MNYYILLMLAIATYKSWKGTAILFINRYTYEMPVPTMMLIIAFIESFAMFMAVACWAWVLVCELINNNQ